MTKLTALFIGFVWPEPTSSAAGTRTLGLIHALKDAHWDIHFVSPSPQNAFTDALSTLGIQTAVQKPNDPAFDTYLSNLKPTVVIFDRFVMEEQFGWRVRTHSLESLLVLDTIDLHFLRRGREEALRQGVTLNDIFDARLNFSAPGGPGFDDAVREIASLYRCDLSLMISPFETKILTAQFAVPAELLLDLPYFFSPHATAPTPSFDQRTHFVSIGNFRHSPNSDSVKWLRDEIWPAIHTQLPGAQVHIYGAYPSREMMALTNAKIGFHVKGPASDAISTLQKYRVNLAPLRFGAGIKGKIIDGWLAGTPNVTTPIGAEGMSAEGEPFAGLVARTAEDFAQACVDLYSNQEQHSKLQSQGHSAVQSNCDYSRNADLFIDALTQTLAEKDARRARNFTGAMLSHHNHQSTVYFSKWIEAKNKAAN